MARNGSRSGLHLGDVKSRFDDRFREELLEQLFGTFAIHIRFQFLADLVLNVAKRRPSRLLMRHDTNDMQGILALVDAAQLSLGKFEQDLFELGVARRCSTNIEASLL